MADSLLTLSLHVKGVSGVSLARRVGLTEGGQNLATVAGRVSALIAAGRFPFPVQLALKADDVTVSSGFQNDNVAVVVTIATHASIADNDVSVIGGVRWTWKTTATTPYQVAIGADAAAAAANLAAKINANTDIAGLFTAVDNLDNTVTVTALSPGVHGLVMHNSDHSGGVTFGAATFAGNLTAITNGGGFSRYSE